MKMILLLFTITITFAANNKPFIDNFTSSYGKMNKFLKKNKYVLAIIPKEAVKLWIKIDVNQTFDIGLYTQHDRKIIGGDYKKKIQDVDYNVSIDYEGLNLKGQFFSNKKGCLYIDNRNIGLPYSKYENLAIKFISHNDENLSFEYQWANYKKLQDELNYNRHLWELSSIEYYEMKTDVRTVFLKQNEYLHTRVSGKELIGYGFNQRLPLLKEEILFGILAKSVEAYYVKIQEYIKEKKFIKIKYNKTYGYPMYILVNRYPDDNCMKKEENFMYRINLEYIKLKGEK